MSAHKRVASEGRQLDRPQDRSERRLRPPRDVRVPVVGRPERAAGGDHEDLGLLLVLRRDGVDLEIAEAPPEGDVAGAVEAVLVAEEHHLPLEERLADLLDHRIVEVVGQLDAADLGADGGGERGDGQHAHQTLTMHR